MSRPLRIEYPGAYYHITSRGNEKKVIFKYNSNRKKFLEYLKEANERFGAMIHTYCLMGNHYHLLLQTPSKNLSQIMHFINCSYSNYFNKLNERSGHLLQGRYKAILIEADEYAKELSRYIHLNPVRAGFVAKPESYPWSSYLEYVGKRVPPKWLVTEFILRYFGNRLRDARKAYVSYVLELAGQDSKSPLEMAISSTILGSSEFIERIKGTYLAGRREDRNLPALRELASRPSLQEIKMLAESIANVNKSLSRKMSILACQKFSGKKLEEIGAFFALSESAVAQVCYRMRKIISKDARLCQVFDELEKNVFMSDV